MAVNVELYDVISKKQLKGRKYSIFNLLKDEDHTLTYIYAVVWNDVLNSPKLTEELYRDIKNHEIDIRKLSTYKEVDSYEIIKTPEKSVIPMIVDAIKKEEIKPVDWDDLTPVKKGE